jgi:aminomethyltransferase
VTLNKIQMKHTPFTQNHIKLGAKMLDFAGYNMPVEYSGIKDEHLCVRNNVGVFDVSHMGEIWVRGENSIAFLQKVTSNDIGLLKPNNAQYTCFTNEKGGIVDDLLVYCFDSENFLLVVNASNIEKDFTWLEQNNSEKAQLENVSDSTAQLAIQGPNAVKVLDNLTNIDLHSMKYYTFARSQFAGIDNVIISATGYTGAGGFEIYFDNKDAQTIWDAIFDAGKPYGIKPVGLGARDTLRLEKGYCLYGNDINDNTSPIEAGLSWITKINDEKNFIGKNEIVQLKLHGVNKKLRGFKMIDRGIPRHGYTIFDENENTIGEVTSGSISPVLGVGIGLGYVKTGFEKKETIIYIKIRNKLLRAKIVALPFL